MSYQKHAGQNLIEAIVAVGIFSILVGAGVTAGLNYFNTQIRAQEQTKLAQISQSTFEILDGLSKNNWAAFTNGAHGLSLSGSDWSLNSTPDTVDNVTRTITIADANRDGSCNLVASGGTPDSDTKLINTLLTYSNNRGTQNKTFSQYITNWPNPVNCVIPQGPGGQAGGLGLNVGTATRQEYFDWINLLVTIDGVRVTNISANPVTINKAQVFTNKPGMTIYGFYINNSKRWGWFGPGTPSGAQPSGSTLDISNYTIQPGQTVTIKMTFFTSSKGVVTFRINFIMEDNTEVDTDEFTI